MTTLEILQEARELLSAPERWTKGLAARNSAGESTAPNASNAVCWCVIGALDRVAECESGWVVATDVLATILPDGWRCVSRFNDAPSTTHADILALYDRAIALEEARQ